jgi:hypothetical protein
VSAKLYSIAQGPGPPQRPQSPGGFDDADLGDAELTAKTLSVRAVFMEPHLGHSIFSRPLIERTSFSKRVSQALHVYS